MRKVADRENVQPLRYGENFTQPALPGRCHEQAVAMSSLLRAGAPACFDRLSIDRFARHSRIEYGAERVFAEHTNVERVHAYSSIVLPSHKFAEVEEVSRFNLKLGRTLLGIRMSEGKDEKTCEDYD